MPGYRITNLNYDINSVKRVVDIKNNNDRSKIKDKSEKFIEHERHIMALNKTDFITAGKTRDRKEITDLGLRRNCLGYIIKPN